MISFRTLRAKQRERPRILELIIIGIIARGGGGVLMYVKRVDRLLERCWRCCRCRRARGAVSTSACRQSVEWQQLRRTLVESSRRLYRSAVNNRIINGETSRGRGDERTDGQMYGWQLLLCVIEGALALHQLPATSQPPKIQPASGTVLVG